MCSPDTPSLLFVSLVLCRKQIYEAVESLHSLLVALCLRLLPLLAGFMAFSLASSCFALASPIFWSVSKRGPSCDLLCRTLFGTGPPLLCTDKSSGGPSPPPSRSFGCSAGPWVGSLLVGLPSQAPKGSLGLCYVPSLELRQAPCKNISMVKQVHGVSR